MDQQEQDASEGDVETQVVLPLLNAVNMMQPSST